MNARVVRCGRVIADREGRAAGILIDGMTREWRQPDSLRSDGAGQTGSDRIGAPMSGTVLSVEVAPGEAVRTGRRLLVLEAMKMEHTLQAPRDGRIACVNVVAGAQVSDADVLVELEPELD